MPSAYVWCPAYALSGHEHHQRTCAGAQALTAALGMDLAVSPRLLDFPGAGCWLDAPVRIADLYQGLGHDLLIAARGGYGCMDLIESVLAWPGARAPTVLGFSDVTVLHALWRRRGWAATIYGMMPGVAWGARALASTLALLRGEALICDGVGFPRVRRLNCGGTRGMLFPACLRVLAGLIGTPAMPDLSGCILAIEDIDERPYRIERDLRQLALSGSLAGVVGLVCGRFPAENPIGYAGAHAEDILSSWARSLGIPGIVELPFGHDSDPLSLPCGRMATLQVDRQSWRLATDAS
jgi:muramoyltetrapeptide carboxypeptidase